MDIRDVEKINQLAVTLKKNGLAASMSEAVEKAKEIILGASKETESEEQVAMELAKVEEEIETISDEQNDTISSERPDDEETAELREEPQDVSEVQQELDEAEEPVVVTQPSPVDEVSESSDTPDVSPPEVSTTDSEPVAESESAVLEDQTKVDIATDPRPLNELMREEQSEEHIAPAEREEVATDESVIHGSGDMLESDAEQEPGIQEDQDSEPVKTDESTPEKVAEDAPSGEETSSEPDSSSEPDPSPKTEEEEPVQSSEPQDSAETQEETSEDKEEPKKEDSEEEKPDLSKYFNFGNK
ncbi:MAG: hypothetical protein QGH47_01060 [Candidatus Woesearchaeota archaeon]|nr:hypothetical protein [Candidatus Woesearchaeota archaeon]